MTDPRRPRRSAPDRASAGAERIARALGVPSAILRASAEARVVGSGPVLEAIDAPGEPWSAALDAAIAALSPAAARALVDLTLLPAQFDGRAARAVLGRSRASTLGALLDDGFLLSRDLDDDARVGLEMPSGVRAAVLRRARPDAAAADRLVAYARELSGRVGVHGLEVGRAEDLERLGDDLPLLGAALRVATDRRDVGAALELAVACAAGHLRTRGLDDARAALDRVIRAAKRARPGPPAGELARALAARARVLAASGAFTEAARAYDDARKAAARGDLAVHALIAHGRGVVLRRLRRLGEARAEAERALATWTRAGEPRLALQARGSLGAIAVEQGDLAGAAEIFAEVVRTAGALREPFPRALGRAYLGHVLHERGAFDDALRSFRLARGAFQRLGDARHDAIFASYEAAVLHEAGRLGEARGAYTRALRLLRVTGAVAFEALARAGLGAIRACAVDARRGEVARAADAFARAEEIAARAGDPAVALAVRLRARTLELVEPRRALARGDAAALSRWSPPTLAALSRDPLFVLSDDVRTAARTLVAACDALQREAVARGLARERVTLAATAIGVGDRTIDLARRPTLLRVASVLVRGHDATWTTAALARAAWPAERILPAAAAHRVRVAISELRALGLRGEIERSPSGYRWVGGPPSSDPDLPSATV